MTQVTGADLEQAMRTTGTVVGQLGDDQLGLSTPCEAWSVTDLLDHLIGMLVRYGTAFEAAVPEPTRGDDSGLEETVEWYAAASSRLLEAVRTADPDRLVTVPFGTVPPGVATGLATVELLVHGWDLAMATGQPYQPDPAVAERALGFSASALAGVPPDRSPFASPVPIDDSAPGIDRLAALLGRRP
jgi:uncharacterized protein (TIGR03086 family)